MKCDLCQYDKGCKDFDCRLQFGEAGNGTLRKIQAENTALKAQVNELREALYNLYRRCDPEMVEVQEAEQLYNRTPEQSLAEHDKKVRNLVLEEIAKSIEHRAYVKDSGKYFAVELRAMAKD